MMAGRAASRTGHRQKATVAVAKRPAAAKPKPQASMKRPAGCAVDAAGKRRYITDPRIPKTWKCYTLGGRPDKYWAAPSGTLFRTWKDTAAALEQ